MPVLKIWFASELRSVVTETGNGIVERLSATLKDELKADPEKCQIIFCESFVAVPAPVYADVQFRANDHRRGEVVQRALSEVSTVLCDAFRVAVRVRGFAINQSTLYAIDVDAPETH